MNTHSVEIFLAVLIGYVLFGVCFLIIRKKPFGRRHRGSWRSRIARAHNRLDEQQEVLDRLHKNQFDLQGSYDGLAADFVDHENELGILRSKFPLPGVGEIEIEVGARQRVFEMFQRLGYHQYEHWSILHSSSAKDVAQFTGLVPAISLKAFAEKLMECQPDQDYVVAVYKRGSPADNFRPHGSFNFRL